MREMYRISEAGNIEDIVRSGEKKPFAFDLGREYTLIQQLGEAYKPFFLKQAAYYAKESYGKVPVVEYEHDVQTTMDGRARLTFGAERRDAVMSYLEPAEDPSFPLWYRSRALADADWAEAMNQELVSAKPGDTFIDLSPTEYDVTYEERKKWGFGVHSFVRVHTFVSEGGGKLVSRSLRNYLDGPEQEKLFTLLTGDQMEVTQLLGKVRKLQEGMQIGHIQQFVDELYAQTPEERRLKPLEDDQVYKNDAEMDEILFGLQNWMEGIYYLIRDEAPKERILQQFRGWENAVRAAVQGETIDLTFFRSIDPRSLFQTYELMPPMQLTTFVERSYTPGGNGCGLGSGFGNEWTPMGTSNIVTTSGPMSYTAMTKNEKPQEYTGENAKNDPNLCQKCIGEKPHFHCGGVEGSCTQKIIVGAGTKSCPSCGKGKVC